MANVNTVSFGPAAMMPDIQSQQIELQRRQQLADMLRKDSVTPIEQQQVSGRVVPISPLQGIAKLGQAYFADKMQKDNDQKQLDIGKQYAQRMADALKSMAPAGVFDDKTPQAAPGQLGSGMMDSVPPPDGAPIVPQPQPSAQIDPAVKQAWVRALNAMQVNPELGTKLLENAATLTNEQKNNAAMGIDSQLMGRSLMAKAVKEGRMEAQPGNTIIDPITLKPLYTAPDFKTGVQGGFVNGQPVMGRIAGSEVIPQMAGETKRAEAGAQAGFDMVTVNTPQGPLMVTREQASNMAGGGVPNSQASTSPQGLDLSKLSPEQQAYLARTDPQAFANGAAHFQRTNMQQQPQQSAQSNPIGIPLESDAQKSFKTKQADNAATAAAALNERVRTGEDLMQRLAESREAMKNFQAGGGKETRARVAQMAQAMGLPDATINKIAGGDLASMQEFQKLAVSQAMETLKQSMATDNGMGGRMTQSEFQQFLKVNPNLSTDPRAIEKLYNFSERVHQRNLGEQQAFDQWVTQGGDPARWPAEWSRRMSAGLPGAAPTAQNMTSPAPANTIGMPTIDAIEAELKRRRGGK